MEADEAEPCCHLGVGSIGCYLQRLKQTHRDRTSKLNAKGLGTAQYNNKQKCKEMEK